MHVRLRGIKIGKTATRPYGVAHGHNPQHRAGQHGNKPFDHAWICFYTYILKRSV